LLDDYTADFKINGKKTLKRAEGCSMWLRSSSETWLRWKSIHRNQEIYCKEAVRWRYHATINRELSVIKRASTLHTLYALKVPCPVHTHAEGTQRAQRIHRIRWISGPQEALPDYLKPVLTLLIFRLEKVGDMGLKWNQVNLRDGIVRLEPGETKNDEVVLCNGTGIVGVDAGTASITTIGALMSST